MRFIKTIIPLFLASVATAAPVAKRSILSDINVITSGISNVVTSVKSFTGDPSQAASLIADLNSLTTPFDHAITSVDDSLDFDDAESAAVTAALASLVSPITTIASDLEAKVCTYRHCEGIKYYTKL